MAQKQHEPGPDPTPIATPATDTEAVPPVADTVSLGPTAPDAIGSTETLAQRLRAAEEALEIVERRFQSTVERIADGILVVDQQGRIRFTNPAGARIFGRVADDLIGSDLGVPLVPGETAQVDLHTPRGTRVAELRVGNTTWEESDALLLSVR